MFRDPRLTLLLYCVGTVHSYEYEALLRVPWGSLDAIRPRPCRIDAPLPGYPRHPGDMPWSGQVLRGQATRLALTARPPPVRRLLGHDVPMSAAFFVAVSLLPRGVPSEQDFCYRKRSESHLRSWLLGHPNGCPLLTTRLEPSSPNSESLSRHGRGGPISSCQSRQSADSHIVPSCDLTPCPPPPR